MSTDSSPASCSRNDIAVEQKGETGVYPQPEMVAATRADALVLVERACCRASPGSRALRPEVRWDAAWRRPPKGSLIGISRAHPTPRQDSAGPIDMPDARAAPPISKRRSGTRGTGSVRGMTAIDTTWRIDSAASSPCNPALRSAARAAGRRALLEQERGVEARQASLEQPDHMADARVRGRKYRHPCQPIRTAVGSRRGRFSRLDVGRRARIGLVVESRIISSSRVCVTSGPPTSPIAELARHCCSERWMSTRVAPSDLPSTSPISRVDISFTKRSTRARRRSVGSARSAPRRAPARSRLAAVGLDVVVAGCVERKIDWRRWMAARAALLVGQCVARDLEEPHAEAAVRAIALLAEARQAGRARAGRPVR